MSDESEIDLEKESLSTMRVFIENRNIQLFNAFSLARPEIFNKKPPYDFEYLAIVTDGFYKYLQELEGMGRHELYTG
jgi:hypothetical protein